MPTFHDYKLDPQILESLDRIGYREPTPIQAQAIPEVLAGHDIIGLAETGSGKTAACAIPVCHRVDPQCTGIQALILVPTRELALQYATEAQKIGKRKGIKAYALFGGEDYGLQQAKLRAGVQVLVATPGRLIDLIYSRMIELDQVATLVLDEADEMMSMGFYEDMVFIIQCLVHKHQTLLFSATMPKQIKQLALEHMQKPTELTLTEGKAAPKQIRHLFAFCPQLGKRADRLLALIEDSRPKQCLVFCNSRRQVEEVCQILKRKLPQVEYIHGGLSQMVRTIITNKFRSGKIAHLVATDVAARGLDFSGVTHVFNFELTKDVDTYIHRSGRTGRSGRSGVAISLVTKRDLKILEQIGRRLKRDPRWLGPPPESPTPSRRQGSGHRPPGRSKGAR